MWRPPGPGSSADEFINHRLKQLHEARFREPRRGWKPGGVFFSGYSVTWVCGLALATGVVLLFLMIFGDV